MKLKHFPKTLSVLCWSSVISLGCSKLIHRNEVSFLGHIMGESYAQFTAIEHPANEGPPGLPYTGTVQCFTSKDLGDKCAGPRHDFDNAYFTFVEGKLTGVATVGAGGIIGHPRQNWNWNLYLDLLKRQYGSPKSISARDAVWELDGYVIHAYLTRGPMPFNPLMEEQQEHVEAVSQGEFAQSHK